MSTNTAEQQKIHHHGSADEIHDAVDKLGGKGHSPENVVVDAEAKEIDLIEKAREGTDEPEKKASTDKMAKKTGEPVEEDIGMLAAVHPAPPPSREHLVQSYPGMYPKLEKEIAAEESFWKHEQSDKTHHNGKSTTTESEKAQTCEEPEVNDEHDYKKAEMDEDDDNDHHHHHHHHRGPIGAVIHVLHLDHEGDPHHKKGDLANDVGIDLMDQETQTRKEQEVNDEKHDHKKVEMDEDDDNDHDHHHHHHRGPIGTVIHALHLDHKGDSHNKKGDLANNVGIDLVDEETQTCEQKEYETTKPPELGDVIQNAQKTNSEPGGEEVPVNTTKEPAKAEEVSATYDPKQSGEMPMAMLNPEGVEAKELEDKMLKSGEYFDHQPDQATNDDEIFVSKELIDSSLAADKIQKQKELNLKEENDLEKPKD